MEERRDTKPDGATQENGLKNIMEKLGIGSPKAETPPTIVNGFGTGKRTPFIETQPTIVNEPGEAMVKAPEWSLREVQALNQLEVLETLGSRFGTGKRTPFSKWIPPKVKVIWFDRAFSVVHIRDLPWIGDGVVADRWWGRAADVLGPNAKPVVITVKGKASTGFLIDGDKGVGFDIERKENGEGAYAKLGTTSELAWAVLDSKKAAEQFGTPTTSRTVLVYCAVSFIIGALVAMSFFAGKH
jgi:hypothetical protein